MMGERMKMSCKMSEYDIEMPFKGYAKDKFEPFNSRQSQTIISKIIEEEVEVSHFTANKIILDHFLLHNDRK